MLDFPMMLSGKDPIIPVGWYLLDNQLKHNTKVVYKTNDNSPVIIIDRQDIASFDNDIDLYLSVIKTDKELKEGDTIKTL